MFSSPRPAFTLRTLSRQIVSLLWPRDADRADQRLIAASGMFDTNYYLLNGDDVAAAGANPVAHFCLHGWREGRRPNLFFDPDWYRSRYLGAERPNDNPLAHYIRQGERDGCKPICFFDPSWYRATYSLRRGDSPLVHYLKHRRTQRFAPTPQFDIAYYLDRYRDEIGPNRDPFMHHIRNGAAMRDLAPSPSFDPVTYRREVMNGDERTWVGLLSHEMRVPLVHRLHGSVPPFTLARSD